MLIVCMCVYVCVSFNEEEKKETEQKNTQFNKNIQKNDDDDKEIVYNVACWLLLKAQSTVSG